MRNLVLLIIYLAIIGCEQGDRRMATIGEETGLEVVSTNVTDSSLVLDQIIESAKISAEYYTTLFVDAGGDLYGFGQDTQGAMGLGSTASNRTLTQLPMSDVKSVYTSGSRSFIIKTDGSLWAAGSNTYGALGLQSIETNIYEFRDTGVRDVKQVVIHNTSVSVLTTDGSVYVAGSNDLSIFGLAEYSASTMFRVFTKLGLDQKITLIGGGRYNLFIVKEDGSIYGSGANSKGQIGSNTTATSVNFTKAETTLPGASVRQIVSGLSSSAILMEDGSFYTSGSKRWGLNDPTGEVPVFTQVTSLAAFKYITNTSEGVAGVTDDGTVYTVGENTWGQLAIGTTADTYSFTQVTVNVPTGKCKGIAMNTLDTFYVASDGSILAAGDKQWMGAGTTGSTSTLIAVHSGANVDTYNDPRVPIVYLKTGDTLNINSDLYSATTLNDEPSLAYSLSLIGVINPLKPFDGEGISPATHDGTVSDMQYVLKGTEVFNAFTVAKVLASSITYTFTLPVGDPEYALWLDGAQVASGGNGIVKTATSTIDCKRDSKGLLSDYPTSRVFYADKQMPVDSTVTISIAYGGTISLGDLTFNNAIKDTLTNLDFGHGIQDYNDYTPDPWGKIPEAVKAKVTMFNITMDVLLENYDYAVSFHESIAGKNVMIDASDSKGQPRDGKRIFSSLIRRVRITNVTSNSIVKEGDLYRLAGVTMSVTEVV